MYGELTPPTNVTFVIAKKKICHFIQLAIVMSFNPVVYYQLTISSELKVIEIEMAPVRRFIGCANTFLPYLQLCVQFRFFSSFSMKNHFAIIILGPKHVKLPQGTGIKSIFAACTFNVLFA